MGYDLDLGNYSSSLGFRLKTGHFDALQFDAGNTRQAIFNSLFPMATSQAHAYVLNGAVNTGTGGGYNISDGFIFTPNLAGIHGSSSFNYEVFALGGGSDASGTPVIVDNYSDVTGNAFDVTTNSNGTTSSIITNRGFKVITGNSSSMGYVCDYSQLVFLTGSGVIDLVATSTIDFESGSGVVTTGLFSYNKFGKEVSFQCLVVAHISDSTDGFTITLPAELTAQSDGVGFNLVTFDFNGSGLGNGPGLPTLISIGSGQNTVVIAPNAAVAGVITSYYLVFGGTYFVQ